MMQLLTKVLVPVLTYFAFGLPAGASVEVNCMEEGCHGELGGYTTLYTRNDGRRSETTTFCENNCNTEGWSELFGNRLISRAQCRGEGCFRDGWDQYSGRGEYLLRVECRRSLEGVKSCDQNGWVMQDIRTGRWVRSTCLYGDCFQFGWDVFNSNGQLIKRARCTDQDCRFRGWIVRP